MNLLFSALMLPVFFLPSAEVLSSREFSMQTRYASSSFVNEVFSDNILLTLAYTNGDKIDGQHVDWEKIKSPTTYSFTLKPGETFAYHDDVLPEYKNKVQKTTNAHFNFEDGFKSSGYLMGDGVCHLASFLYWAAKDAELSAYAPVRHDFMPIPEVPREYGVSIYANPGEDYSDQMQNLYITNTKENDVTFRMVYDGKSLTVTVEETI